MFSAVFVNSFYWSATKAFHHFDNYRLVLSITWSAVQGCSGKRLRYVTRLLHFSPILSTIGHSMIITVNYFLRIKPGTKKRDHKTRQTLFLEPINASILVFGLIKY